MDFDRICDHIGHFGLYQLYICVLASLPMMLSGIHDLANIFLMAIPRHRCWIQGCDKTGTPYNATFLPFTSPVVSKTWSKCFQYDYINDTRDSCERELFTKQEIECHKWVYDNSVFIDSTVTKWNLVCDHEFLVSVAQSVFMFGILCSSLFLGTVADRFGRSILFLVAPPFYFISSLATAFSPNFTIFIILRFITAMSTNGLFQNSYVLAIELMGPSCRLWSSQLFQVLFAVGELVLGVIAYFLRDWMSLQLAISAPVAILLLYYWLMPESIMWQLTQGRTLAAAKSIKVAAKWNGKKITDSKLDLKTVKAQKKTIMHVVDLFRSSALRWRTINLCFNWFVNALVYYGLSLSAGRLSGNTHFNFMALAAVEIPAVLFSGLILKYFSLRRCVLACLLLSAGVFCGIIPFLSQEHGRLITVLAVLGKSCIAASFSVLYLYSSELYPTTHRNTGIGIGSTHARIGSILAPFVSSELRHVYPSAPMGVFGIFSLIAGTTTFLLPETGDHSFPQTIQEIEEECGHEQEEAIGLLTMDDREH